MGLLRTVSHSPARVLLLLSLLRQAPFVSSPQQPSVDFFGTQVRERRIDQCPGRKCKTVSEQNRVDGEVGGSIPEFWIAFAASALMPQRAVQDLVRERSLEFSRLEFIDESGAINDPAAVRSHRRQRARYQLQPQSQRSKERLIE
jgi:hypothetical protein